MMMQQWHLDCLLCIVHNQLLCFHVHLELITIDVFEACIELVAIETLSVRRLKALFGMGQTPEDRKNKK